ncbi:MAG: hydroxymethylglutaryl-CoA lyase [Nitrospinae bacterium]|nr:hydroxymethylglutaryl-CoA lyase [Nitrospinota bacterium]
MSLPTKVDIVEVGTRDGLQNEKTYITPEDKIRLLDTITDAGVRRIEVTSFVSPKHVPQLRDAQEVLAGCKRSPDAEYEALVPNVRGMERALECELDGVMLFVAASETFNLKNIRASRKEMLGVAREVARMALDAGLKLRGGVVATFGCPYEGRISYEDVEWVVGEYVDMGCAEIGLADTVGMSNPAEIKRLTSHIRDKFPSVRYALHLHNTRGAGLANLLAGLEVGVDTFDTSPLRAPRHRQHRERGHDQHAPRDGGRDRCRPAETPGSRRPRGENPGSPASGATPPRRHPRMGNGVLRRFRRMEHARAAYGVVEKAGLGS